MLATPGAKELREEIKQKKLAKPCGELNRTILVSNMGSTSDERIV
jgi:hypothetical protein